MSGFPKNQAMNGTVFFWCLSHQEGEQSVCAIAIALEALYLVLFEKRGSMEIR
jgi:hypothetical protein